MLITVEINNDYQFTLKLDDTSTDREIEEEVRKEVAEYLLMISDYKIINVTR